jgi:hypothetical protein
MRKLKLTELQFASYQILGREQLKNVLGGSGGGLAFCDANCSCPDGFVTQLPIICQGTCSATDNVGVTCVTGWGTQTYSCDSAPCPTPPPGG